VGEFVVEDCLEWGYDLFVIRLACNCIVGRKVGAWPSWWGGFHVKYIHRHRRYRKVELWEDVAFQHRVLSLVPLCQPELNGVVQPYMIFCEARECCASNLVLWSPKVKEQEPRLRFVQPQPQLEMQALPLSARIKVN
jgi:hypothetical protein